MLTASLHKEDIKAALRKRHGTLAAFAAAREIKPQALADWMRGRTSAPVEAAVAAELAEAEAGDAGESMKLDDSASRAAPHRLNAGAR